MGENIITPILNIIGLVFEIIGVAILSVSLLAREHFSTLSKLFLKLSKGFRGKKLPTESKDWFFERTLKEIFAYTGSFSIEPKGFRYSIGFAFILVGFLLQIFANLLSLISLKDLLIVSFLVYLALFFFFSRKGFIDTFKKAFRGMDNKVREDFKKPYNLKVNIVRFMAPVFIALFALNMSVFYSISVKFLFFLLKLSRWILSIGISKKERERVREKAYKEFEDRYGKDWESISKKIFEEAPGNLSE